MAKRAIFTVRWDKKQLLWICREQLKEDVMKSALVRTMSEQLKRAWKQHGILSQLRVFGKDGRIQSERTYGKDPKRYPS